MTLPPIIDYFQQQSTPVDVRVTYPNDLLLNVEATVEDVNATGIPCRTLLIAGNIDGTLTMLYTVQIDMTVVPVANEQYMLWWSPKWMLDGNYINYVSSR